MNILIYILGCLREADINLSCLHGITYFTLLYHLCKLYVMFLSKTKDQEKQSHYNRHKGSPFSLGSIWTSLLWQGKFDGWRVSKCLLVMSWAWALLLSSPPLLGWGHYVREPGTNIRSDNSTHTFNFVQNRVIQFDGKKVLKIQH